jgi:hypothetical protein
LLRLSLSLPFVPARLSASYGWANRSTILSLPAVAGDANGCKKHRELRRIPSDKKND